MTQEILINIGAAEIRIAVVEGGKLQALSCERTLGTGGGNGRSCVGDIILGRAVRVVPAVQAAFVEIGHERAGFLGAHEARCLAKEHNAAGAQDPAIGELVREGDEVLVQVVKDPIGEKGARLSASVAIPGRLCVLAPHQPGVALSRRIEDEPERARLAALGEALTGDTGGDLVADAGYIFRTAAIGAEFEALREDARRLAQNWQAIKAARKTAKPPALLHRDLDAVERAIRDRTRGDTARILIDDAGAAEAARAFCRRAVPGAEDRVALFTGPGALFDLYDLESDIDGLMHPRVTLPCGGWITIERTEALTAVDVNSGSFAESSTIEDAGLAVNLQAAQEIGRQLRLRGIGGLVVIDFISMQDKAHEARVVAALSENLLKDGVPVTISAMSPLGLVELTRKRVREPLAASVSESCGACAGQGVLRRPDAVAMDILRRVEAGARAAPGKVIRVHAAPEVAAWLEEQGDTLRTALARRGAPAVEFIADKTCTRERFDVGTVA
ncbi:MAG: Rne/Rng family ribonuclease [Alphaproteobacteria bacterium]|nr:Rne/Rng family ribonuclease [Alphaproteobacteria bacterium]MDE2494010.1 Rne/Rng family ribonuclease [Alphaproteobacteria bacterium]